MKRKVLFILSTIAIAVVLTFNVTISKSSDAASMNLSMNGSLMTAQAEGGCTNYCGYNCCCTKDQSQSSCYWSNTVSTSNCNTCVNL